LPSRYGDLATLEEGYGINLLPLATFAMDVYKNDSCSIFMPKTEQINSECKAFVWLQNKLKGSYKPYTDKGRKAQKQRNLQDCVQEVLHDLKQTVRTREQSINTAKLLYRLADNAVRLSVEETLSVSIQEQNEDIDIVPEPKPCMEFG